jgi:pyroglutamyl-peptidase
MSSYILTGFGPFGDVVENPSSENLKFLVPIFPNNIRKIQLNVPVSVSGADECLEELLASLVDEECTVVHFGVSERSDCILIEQFGYNEMTFRFPDADGNVFDNAVIDINGAEKLETVLNLSCISHPRVKVSTDPGRYICNYIYYRSLQRIGPRCLFIHVPPYSKMSREDQIDLIGLILHSF